MKELTNLSNRIQSLGRLMVLVIGLMAVSTGATHAATTAPTSGESKAAGQNCTLNANNGELQCFSSFRAAITQATGGRVTNASDNAKTALADKRFDAQLNQTSESRDIDDALQSNSSRDIPVYVAWPPSYVIGIEYDNTWYTWDTLTVYANSACTTTISDIDFEVAFPQLNGVGWDNKIASFRSYNNCWTRGWEHPNRQGSVFGYYSAAGSLGWMNDRISHLDFSLIHRPAHCLSREP
jgi:hypothetical protein